MRRAAWTTLGVLLGLGALALLYGFSLEAFARGVDFNRGTFEDFTGTYYPQARQLWRVGEPVPVPGFLYTPAAALALAPLGALEPGPASWLWLAVQLLALGLVPWLAAVVVGERRAATLVGLGGVTALAFPVVHNLHWGQVSTLLVVLVLAALTAECACRRGWAAVGLGLAIAIKVYPVLLLLPWALRGRWRPVLGALAVAGGLGLGLPALLWGVEPTADFLRLVWARGQALSDPDGPWFDSSNRQYLPAVLMRWKGLVPAWQYGLFQAVSLGLFAGLLEWVRRALQDGERVRPWVALWTGLPLVLSPCWPHYLAGLPLAWAVGWSVGTRESRVLTGLSIVLASTPLARAVNAVLGDRHGSVFELNSAFPYLGFLTLSAAMGVLAVMTARPVRLDLCARSDAARRALAAAGEGPTGAHPGDGEIDDDEYDDDDDPDGF